MRNLLITAAVLFVAVFVIAQTFGPPTVILGAPIATNVSQCPALAAHQGGWCPVESASGIDNYFWNGTAWAQIAGSPGPAGPPGPPGPPGVAGPAGSPGIPAAGQAYSENCGQATLSTGTTTNGTLVTHQCTATIP